METTTTATTLPTGEKQLHVGLLNLNSKFFYSPTPEAPSLFVDKLADYPGLSFEIHSRTMLARRGIFASSLFMLPPSEISEDQGYLLRENRVLNPDEYGLTAFSRREMDQYVGNRIPGIQGHFLAHILRRMN